MSKVKNVFVRLGKRERGRERRGRERRGSERERERGREVKLQRLVCGLTPAA